MGATEFATGSAQTVQRWSNDFFVESMEKTFLKKFSGTSVNSIVKIQTDLETNPGDQIKYDLRYANRGDGVQGDTTMEGFEEELEYYQETMKIDQLRNSHAVRKMSQQRTLHDVRAEARDSLTTWGAWKLDSMLFAYLAGVAGDGSESASGTLGSSGFAGNALAVPAATRHINRTTSAITLSDINKLKTMAQTVNPRIDPVMVNGQHKYCMVIHPYSALTLQTETGVEGWRAITSHAGERGSKNPIYTGALGEYNGVVLHVSEYIPTADAAGAWSGATINQKANVFLGAGAASIAFGNAWGGMGSSNLKSPWRVVEQERDFKNKRSIGVAACFGIQKNVFNSLELGVLRLTTTDVAPS